METVLLSHADIGEIKGAAKGDRVAQFSGIHYATIKDRFAPPVLKRYNNSDKIDATKIGAQVHSHSLGPDFEFVLLQRALDYDRSTQYTSDLDCLNLNVTVPLDADGQVKTNRILPVFAFIHGGGFNLGSAAYPQYDMARFVQLSVEIGKPLIAVNMNYRLNAPGFLTSHELRAGGYEINNALRDQRAAVEWVRSYISGFGGDPENITVAGESAGAVSVNYHLHSLEPLFKRCILMSGSELLMPPIAIGAAEGNYQKLVNALGFESLQPEERIQKLLEMDGKELCTEALKAGFTSSPVLDHDIIEKIPAFENITQGTLDTPGRNWCQGAIIGDCQFDGNIMSYRLLSRKMGIASAIYASFTKTLESEETANRVLSAYNISPSTHDDEAFQNILELITDFQFYAPTIALAYSLSPSKPVISPAYNDISHTIPVHVYRFNAPNPWPGTFEGKATHILDLVFLLQNFNEHLPLAQQEQARRFAERVIGFVNGEQPWEGWKINKKMALVVAEEGGVSVENDGEGKTGRRSIIRELAREVGMDRLDGALRAFLEGR